MPTFETIYDVESKIYTATFHTALILGLSPSNSCLRAETGDAGGNGEDAYTGKVPA
jgi:hypothetical protein